MQNVSNEILLRALGARLRYVRKNKNLTQEELAFLCNNHGTQIGRIERGELNITISSLHVLLRQMNISWAEFFDDEQLRETLNT